MELKMTTALETLIPTAISFNFDELKAEIGGKLEFYKKLVVTEDAITCAKKDKATLNNLSKALNSQRIAQQREYMKPFDEYKAKVDEIVGMIQEPVDAIDRQLKEFDEARKQEKRSAIENFFKVNAGDLSDLLPLEKIWNDKWLNAAFKLIDATQEIMESLSRVKNDLGRQITRRGASPFVTLTDLGGGSTRESERMAQDEFRRSKAADFKPWF